ncbi:hypothetical protein COCC4DRAFT_29271 [Bipolaris maydis ATCC 48331]|uniref:Uncharacterized protein n=2 Tax=Cochliobolus heterostrophus TaxID=5016 RepID=M2UAE4_COCH5|nr:uncharacterized protein COCC4DRAFT_29271 [Bipolaris maydis ATCC 48331]EMD95559.1 hypothetical protein COCHEDRAFT_1019282 [Bipolaris maydis C5]ENI10421.1 hypothetical protein COCC4DRAFT_29271 [Bipolaris maydis ATCC 48331]
MHHRFMLASCLTQEACSWYLANVFSFSFYTPLEHIEIPLVSLWLCMKMKQVNQATEN